MGLTSNKRGRGTPPTVTQRAPNTTGRGAASGASMRSQMPSRRSRAPDGSANGSRRRLVSRRGVPAGIQVGGSRARTHPRPLPGRGRLAAGSASRTAQSVDIYDPAMDSANDPRLNHPEPTTRAVRSRATSRRAPRRGETKRAPGSSSKPPKRHSAAVLSAAFMQKLVGTRQYSIDKSIGASRRSMVARRGGSAVRPRRRPRAANERKGRRKLTLAQRVGIDTAPAAPLAEGEWQAVRGQAIQRGAHSQPCPICCEPFRTAPQVILSCSHVFHHACLRSFERFLAPGAVRSCPMCRAKDYQKKRITDGASIYRQYCVVKIQATIRGFLARRRFLRYLEKNPPSDPRVRQKYLMKQLSRTADALVSTMDAKDDAIDALFAQLDSNLELSRMAMSAAGMRAAVLPDEAWEDARVQAYERQEATCPICMGSLCRRARKGKKGERAPVVLLNCSHMFHCTCIESYERFAATQASGRAPPCPICRSAYIKRNVQVTPKSGDITFIA